VTTGNGGGDDRTVAAIQSAHGGGLVLERANTDGSSGQQGALV